MKYPILLIIKDKVIVHQLENIIDKLKALKGLFKNISNYENHGSEKWSLTMILNGLVISKITTRI